MSLLNAVCCGETPESGKCCIVVADRVTDYFPCYGQCVITRTDTDEVYRVTDFSTEEECDVGLIFEDGNGGFIGDCVCIAANNERSQQEQFLSEADCSALIGGTADFGASGDLIVVSVEFNDNEFPYETEWTVHAAEPSGVYFKNCFPPEKDEAVTTCEIISPCVCADLNAITETTITTTQFSAGENCDDQCQPCVFCCSCTEWRIVEVGYSGTPGVYQQSSSLCNVPAQWVSPAPFDYNGYMQLQINCLDGGWQTAEAWTVVADDQTPHIFDSYGEDCTDCGEASLLPLVITYTQVHEI